MAKGKFSRGQRDGNTPSSLATLLAPQQTRIRVVRVTPTEIGDAGYVNALKEQQNYVRTLEDRRQYSPHRYRPAVASVRSATRLVMHPLRSFTTEVGNRVDPRIRFALPDRVAICVRRKIRREVVHALRLKTKGGRGGGRRRRTDYSGIKC